MSNTLSSIPIFAPTQISGCQLWLDGADSSSMAFSGTSITTWRDKSGNANNATATGTPTLGNTINGVQSVVAGSGNYFNGAVTISTTTLTCFAVALTTAALPKSGVDQRLVSLANTTNVDFNNTSSAIAFFNQGTTSTIATYRSTGPLANNAIVQNVAFMAVSQYDGTNAYLWFNGSAGTLASSASSGSFAITKYGIANQANPVSEFWLGSIGEVVLYNTSLSTAQRQQVEGYLAWKWGLQGSLPSTHPFRNSPIYPTTTLPPQFRSNLATIPMAPSSTPFVFGFNPISISSCSLWLDAADSSTFTFTGANVSQWRDKSGNGYNATGFGGTTRTSFVSGTGINLNGTDGYFYASNASPMNSTANLTAFVVARARPMNIPNTWRLLGFGDVDWNNSANAVAFNMANAIDKIGFERNNVAQTITQTFTTPFDFVGSVVFTGTTASQFLNGTTNSTASSTFTNFGYSLYNIGRFSGGGLLWAGIICEVLAYNAALTTAQRQQVEGYLAWKWGLPGSLPSNHPFKNSPPGLTIPVVPARLTMNTRVFSPLRFSGCTLWLDGADTATITTSGVNVTAWRDKASNLTFSNSGTVTYTASARTMNFTGSNVLTNATGISTSTAVNQFVVWNTSVGSTRQRIFQQTYNSQYAFGITDTTVIQNIYSASVGYAEGPATYSINTNYIYSANTRSPTVLSYSVNGTETIMTSSYTPGLQITSLFVGGTSLFPFSGSVMEVIQYDAFFSLAQTQQIEGYLAWKWGLQGSLPATHPFKKFPPPP